MTTKKDLIKDLTKGQSVYTQVLVGKAFDRGIEEGYRNGFKDANHYGSTCFIACTLLALNDVFGFSTVRMARLVPAIQDKLLDTLCAMDAVEECKRRFGLVINEGELFDED